MIYRSKFATTIGDKHEVQIIADDTLDDLTVKIISETWPLNLPITMVLTGPNIEDPHIRGMALRYSPWLAKETLDALATAIWVGWQAIIKEIRASPKAIEAAEQMQPIPEGQR